MCLILLSRTTAAKKKPPFIKSREEEIFIYGMSTSDLIPGVNVINGC